MKVDPRKLKPGDVFRRCPRGPKMLCLVPAAKPDHAETAELTVFDLEPHKMRFGYFAGNEVELVEP